MSGYVSNTLNMVNDKFMKQRHKYFRKHHLKSVNLYDENKSSRMISTNAKSRNGLN